MHDSQRQIVKVLRNENMSFTEIGNVIGVCKHVAKKLGLIVQLGLLEYEYLSYIILIDRQS